MCSFFVLVVIYINLGHVRLYHFIHLPNCRITVLAKVPGFCPCVVSTWPLISENALFQMNGAFQMKYCMGPNSAIFHLRIFRWGGIWTRVSQLRCRRSIHYSTSSRSRREWVPDEFKNCQLAYQIGPKFGPIVICSLLLFSGPRIVEIAQYNFHYCPWSPLKMTLALKVVKIDSKYCFVSLNHNYNRRRTSFSCILWTNRETDWQETVLKASFFL